MAQKPKNAKTEKKVTRYTYEQIKEPRTPETGHTSLLPADEKVVTLSMDNGWTKATMIGKLPDDERPVLVDMDPAAEPVLFWAGKRNRREVPVLPLQRNEIVSESRIAQVIERGVERLRRNQARPVRDTFSPTSKRRFARVIEVSAWSSTPMMRSGRTSLSAVTHCT
jgi:hypothetical protein